MPYKDKDKQKAAQKAWYDKNKELTIKRSNGSREKRKQVIREIKESSSCMDCNIYYPYYIMQFDHRDSDLKHGSVNNMLTNSSFGKVIKEIEKCDLVCANCHAARTWKRQHSIDI
jgi:hypothetical protein